MTNTTPIDLAGLDETPVAPLPAKMADPVSMSMAWVTFNREFGDALRVMELEPTHGHMLLRKRLEELPILLMQDRAQALAPADMQRALSQSVETARNVHGQLSGSRVAALDVVRALDVRAKHLRALERRVWVVFWMTVAVAGMGVFGGGF